MTAYAFDEACWLADSNVMIVVLNVGINADGVILSAIRGGDAIAVYSFFGRQTKIDVSEYLRREAYGTGDGKISGSFWLRLNGSDQDYDLQVTYSTQGRANPEREWMVADREDGFQLLPSVIYGNELTTPYGFEAPILIPSGEVGTWSLRGDVSGNVALTVGAVTNASISGANNELQIVQTYNGVDTIVQRVRVKRQQCDEERVVIRWRSRSGGYKRVLMDRCKAIHSQVDRVTLEDSRAFAGAAQTPQSFYRGYAGEEEEFSLKVEHLTAYDMWWYSDLLTSDFVAVAAESFNDSTSKTVEVLTKSITIPDGSESDATFEIKVKYRTTDAFKLDSI